MFEAFQILKRFKSVHEKEVLVSLAATAPDVTTTTFRLRLVENGHHHTRKLSRDDVRLLAVIATGIPIASVAGRLEVSDRTVRRRVRVICETLEVTTMIEAVTWAARRGLI